MAIGNSRRGVGTTNCKACAQRPAFEILPCHHTTCYNCYIRADDALLAVCGLCHQHIESIAEMKMATPVVDKTTADWSAPRYMPGPPSALEAPVKADLRKKLEVLKADNPLPSLTEKTKTALRAQIPSSTLVPAPDAQTPFSEPPATPLPEMLPPRRAHFDSPSSNNRPRLYTGQGKPQFNSANASSVSAPPVQAQMPSQGQYGFTYSQGEPPNGQGPGQGQGQPLNGPGQGQLPNGHGPGCPPNSNFDQHNSYAAGQAYNTHGLGQVNNGFGEAQTHSSYAPEYTWGPPSNAQHYPVQASSFHAPQMSSGLQPGYGPLNHQYGNTGAAQDSNSTLGTDNNRVSTPRPKSQYYVETSTNVKSRASGIADIIRSGALDFPDEDSAVDDRARTDRRHSSASSITPQASASRVRSSSIEQAMKKLQLGSASIASTTKEGDIRGNTIAFLTLEEKPAPQWFIKVVQGGYKPTVKEIFESLPVIEACRIAAPSNAGVIVIRNIPYATPRSELTAFVGRNAQVVGQPDGSPYFAVHVIMERHTGKTMDSFVEFARASEAMFVVNTLRRRTNQGRPPKIGDRVVEVEISSQEELMEALFPRTKNVVWEGAIPKLIQDEERYYQGVTATGFTGFLQDEEIVLMTKHAETPQRSPFAQRCMIRCYESLISTLHKYPWYAIDHVNMHERNKLYDATYASVRALVNHLRRGPAHLQAPEPNKPTHTTLQELVVAVLTCPGFSEKQKVAVITVCTQGGFGNLCTSRGMNLRFGGVFPLANNWPFRALVKNPKVNDQLLEYFARLMRDGNDAETKLTLVEQHAIDTLGVGFQPFGLLDIPYGTATTMAQVGRAELNYVEKTLRCALEGPSAVDTPRTTSSDVFLESKSNINNHHGPTRGGVGSTGGYQMNGSGSSQFHAR